MNMAEIGASSYRRFLRLDANSLDQILIAYSDALVRFAYSIVQDAATAEDIAAESMAILLTRQRYYKDEAHLRAYLYKVARNKAIDYLRQRKNVVPLEDVEQVLGSGDPELALLETERNGAIYRCMQHLPEQYRQVLQLAYFDGFGIREISRITRTNQKQIYNRLARAKARMKSLLEKEGITHEDF